MRELLEHELQAAAAALHVVEVAPEHALAVLCALAEAALPPRPLDVIQTSNHVLSAPNAALMSLPFG